MAKLIKAIRWTARIWSLVSLGFVFLFLIGYALSPTDRWPQGFEWLLMGFFPIGLVFFMLIAWRWEKWGSILALVCLAAFYLGIYIQKGIVVRGPYVLLLSAPAVLFLISWIIDKNASPRNSL